MCWDLVVVREAWSQPTAAIDIPMLALAISLLQEYWVFGGPRH